MPQAGVDCCSKTSPPSPHSIPPHHTRNHTTHYLRDCVLLCSLQGCNVSIQRVDRGTLCVGCECCCVTHTHTSKCVCVHNAVCQDRINRQQWKKHTHTQSRGHFGRPVTIWKAAAAAETPTARQLNAVNLVKLRSVERLAQTSTQQAQTIFRDK